MTISEKILAKASGRSEVSPDDIIRARPQFATSHDFYTYPHWTGFLEIAGIKRLHDPSRVVIVVDHGYPAPDTKWAAMHKGLREWVKAHGVKYFYYGEGIGHQILGEKGHALPGGLLVADDPHCNNLGAWGCLSIGVGSSIVEAYACGDVWVRVPHSIKIELTGEIPAGVMARDVCQKVLGDLGDGGAIYDVIEYTGSAVTKMSIDDRCALCNRVLYTGAKAAIVNPDQKTFDYVKGRAKDTFESVTSDPDAVYRKVMKYDVSQCEPLVALPGHPLATELVEEVKSVGIDQAFIGTCAGARFEELREVALMLKGKKVSPDVRLIVNPASSEILGRLVEEGFLSILLQSGVTLETPGCGPCFGGHSGLLAEGETCISTGVNNFAGRMGGRSAKIYLASALTVAASALSGTITDPRSFI